MREREREREREMLMVMVMMMISCDKEGVDDYTNRATRN